MPLEAIANPVINTNNDIDDNQKIVLDGAEVGNTSIPGVKVRLNDGVDSFNDLEFKPVKKIYLDTGNISEMRLLKNNETATFSVEVTPPENTEIKVEAIPDKNADGTTPELFVMNRKFVKIRQGDNYSFRFTAIGTQVGTLNFYNRNKELVATTRYKILPYKGVYQNLSTGFTSNVNVIGGDFDSGPNVNISYSRSGDKWSNSIGVSGGPSGASVNANFSWSW